MSIKVLEEKLGARRQQLAAEVESRTALFAKVDGIREKVDALEAKEDLSAEDAASFKALSADLRTASRDAVSASDKIHDIQADIRQLQNEIDARQEHNKLSASLESPSDRQTGDEDIAPKAPAKAKAAMTKEEADKDISDFFRASYLAKYHNCSINQVLAGQVDDDREPGKQYKNPRLAAVVNTTTNASLVPAVYSTRLIELLRPAAVVRNLPGLRQVPMPSGNLSIPRQATSSTANYVGEMANMPVSNPTSDAVQLQAKKLTVHVIESGEMMRWSNPSSDALIRDDMTKVYGEKEDVTFIRATASATVPGGLKYWADQLAVSQVIATLGGAAPTIQQVKTVLGNAKLALRSANSPMRAPAWLLSPRTEQHLMDMVDGNGNAAFPEMERGLLRGFPYRVTTQIPENLGGGTDATEIYLVDATEFLVGDTTRFELAVSTEAAYHDGANVQAAFSQDAVVFRLIAEHDTAMRHLQSVAYVTGVQWGA